MLWDLNAINKNINEITPITFKVLNTTLNFTKIYPFSDMRQVDRQRYSLSIFLSFQALSSKDASHLRIRTNTLTYRVSGHLRRLGNYVLCGHSGSACVRGRHKFCSYGHGNTIHASLGTWFVKFWCYGLDGPWIKSRWGEISRILAHRQWGPPSLCTLGTMSLSCE